MTFRLFEATVVNACEKHWPANYNECNKFVSAVASELRVFLPGMSGDADTITWWIENWLPTSGAFFSIPAGNSASAQAAQFANMGYFVIAGMTSEELTQAKGKEWHPPLTSSAKVEHGHVAVAVPGFGQNGWPRGYWGSHKSTGKKNESLSKAFPWKHPEMCHYFAAAIPGATML